MPVIVTILIGFIAVFVWGFLSTKLIGYPPLTGIGGALIGLFFIGLLAKNKDKSE